MTQTDAREVLDLGEDGDQWMVLHAADRDSAIDAVQGQLKDQGVLDEYDIEWDQVDAIYREDWWWQPVNEEYPDEEAYLRNIAAHGAPEHMVPFTGWLVELS